MKLRGLFAIASLLLASCASMEVDWVESANDFPNGFYNGVALDRDLSVIDRLTVSIRYPVVIDAQARPEFVDQMRRTLIWSPNRYHNHCSQLQICQQAEQILDFNLNSSQYMAVQLFDQLSKSLPDANVILVPAKIVRTGPRNFSLVDIYSPPPIALAVDVAAHNTLLDDMGQDYTTFGAHFMPLVTARTAASVAPSSQGSLISLTRLPPLPARNGATLSVYTGANTNIAEIFSDLRISSGDLSVTPAKPTKSLPVPSGGHLKVNRITFREDKGLVVQQANQKITKIADAATIDPFTGYSNAIVSALNSLDASRLRQALDTDFVRFVSIYDPRLGGKISSGKPLTKNDHKRVNDLRACWQAELNFTTMRSRQVADRLFLGRFGEAYRDILADQQKTLNEARSRAIASTAMILLANTTSIVTGTEQIFDMGQQMAMHSNNAQIDAARYRLAISHYEDAMTDALSLSVTLNGRIYKKSAKRADHFRAELIKAYRQAYGVRS